MAAVLVTRPTVTHAGLAVLSLAVAGASIHSRLPTEGRLRLSRPGCLVLCRGGHQSRY